MLRNFADRDPRGFHRNAAAVFAGAHTVVESSRDVSDPTSRPRTLTPGSVRGSLTSRLRVGIVRWFAHANVTNIDSGSDRKCTRQSGARFITIRGRSSAANNAVMSCRSVVTSLLLVAGRSLAHRGWIFISVLGGVNALRCASTVRSARPAGVDPACAPLDLAFARWSRFDRR